MGLAKKLAEGITRPAIPSEPAALESWASSQRGNLATVIRYKPVAVENAWRIWNSNQKGLETLSYRFDFTNQLSATGVWLKAISAPAKCPSHHGAERPGPQGSGRSGIRPRQSGRAGARA